MFKVIVLLKRKKGMSFDEFKRAYEAKHAIVGRSVAPLMRKYVRNFLTPASSELAPEGDPPFDCVTEVWYDSEEDYRRTMEANASDPNAKALLAQDREDFFDGSKTRWYTVCECETDLSKP